MAKLAPQLELERCPHCTVDQPNLLVKYHLVTKNHEGQNERHWKFYICSRCGGAVIAWSLVDGGPVLEVHPSTPEVNTAVPSPARDYLKQALESIHAPAGAVMLAASSVDAMLKAKGYKEGTLYQRIDKAVQDHVITAEMGKWAHEVRLDANEPRHADDTAPLPTDAGAKKAVDFVQALAQLLFVLPARVQRGLEAAKDRGEK